MKKPAETSQNKPKPGLSHVAVLLGLPCGGLEGLGVPLAALRAGARRSEAQGGGSGGPYGGGSLCGGAKRGRAARWST